MNKTWDLSILYSGYDDKAFTDDLQTLDAAIAEINSLAEEADALSSSDLLHRYISAEEKCAEYYSKLGEYAFLRYSADTSDMQALGLSDRLGAKLSGCAAADARIQHKIAGIPDLEQIIDSDESLSEYRYYLLNIRRDAEHLLSDREEELFAMMNISGASAWEGLHDTLTSTVKVNYRGEEITLSSVRNLAYDPDPQVRRDAYDAELACYKSIEDASAFSLNSIKLQVINECRLRGFESPLAKALYQSRMKKETLDALLSAIKDYLPKFWEYLQVKGEALGHNNGLPWYELFAPMGKSSKKYTAEEARDYLLDIFGRFDADVCNTIRRAFDEAWIDFYPRDGKVGGAFDCGVASAKQSRVLTNFDGAFGDIVTLAHELGHAFHDQMVFSHSVLNQDYSMPVAETASTFNEVVVVSKAIELAQDKDEKLALIENQLSDACQIICDIYSRYLFESSVFENRPDEFLSAERLCELMLEAQKTAYGDGLDQTQLHPYMWLCKGHYYSGDLSFYNFPYAFGGLFARGLYAKYLSEGDSFLPVYKKLLHATSVCDVEETAMIAGIDLTDKAFWEKGLQSLSDEIDQFISLIRE